MVCPMKQEYPITRLTILFPLCLLVVGTALEYTGFDLWWVSHFYDAQTHTWPFRHHWLFNTVNHEGGRYFNMGAGLLWLMIFSATFFARPLKRHRKIMVCFLVAAASGPLIVGMAKQTTHIYTPWDLSMFSGTMPYIRLFDPVPKGSPIGQAFPSGHASGGYAYLSLYFLISGRPYRKYGLLFGLGLGTLFGIGQQVRGAHFPSHDLFSMVICWYAALIVYPLFYPNKWKGYRS